jgi:hypothetical protein
MPSFFRASVFQPIARTRNASIVRGTAAVIGPTPNGNTQILTPETLRTSAVLRNIHNIFVPASTEVLWYGYSDDVDLTLTGFPLEAGSSIAIEAGKSVFVKVGGAVALPYAIDDGLE